MIDATELRIGNLILFEDGSIIEVRGIHPSGKNIHDGKKWIEVFRLNPIPLTEEWLLKFGFEKLQNPNNTPSLIWKIDWTFVFVQSIFDDLFYYFPKDGNRITLKSVHQLQNLYFALKGTELTIK